MGLHSWPAGPGPGASPPTPPPRATGQGGGVGSRRRKSTLQMVVAAVRSFESTALEAGDWPITNDSPARMLAYHTRGGPLVETRKQCMAPGPGEARGAGARGPERGSAPRRISADPGKIETAPLSRRIFPCQSESRAAARRRLAAARSGRQWRELGGGVRLSVSGRKGGPDEQRQAFHQTEAG